jgi:mannose-6-phosphate isomerase-like protein (cupin superfamily)
MTRRSLAALLPALALRAQSKHLDSKAYLFAGLPSKVSPVSNTHAVIDGETHTGYPVEVHITELNPGQSPHAPHRHVHEEIMFIQSGQVDATVNGNTTRLTPGSVFYVNSNDLHGLHNPGPDRAEYFVIALGPKS